MERKIALVLASLLALSLVLTTPLYLQDTTVEAVYPPWHWTIELAQKKCNALIVGYLTYYGEPIPGTEFELNCTCTGKVFWKVATLVIPTDIHFIKYIDWNKDGIYEEETVVDGNLIKPPTCTCWYHHQQERILDLRNITLFNPTAPICSEWNNITTGAIYHLSSWEDTGWPYGVLNSSDQVDLTPLVPPGPVDWWHVENLTLVSPGLYRLILNKLVVVEVHEQPYDPKDPFFYWQLTMKQHGCQARWTGFLTRDGTHLPTTDFDIECNRTLKCKVVQTPWCTVPNDIDSGLTIDNMPPGIAIVGPITQFPWTYVYVAAGMNVTLELTEVQMHRYYVMGGWLNSAGQLDGLPAWNTSGWRYGDGVPFASRAPQPMPLLETQNITFTNKDPITGIVEISVPAESYTGLDHMWYSFDQGTWFRARILLEEQGCGWIFTGEGKEPILGSVDLRTYNNYSKVGGGVYTFGPDHIAKTADDELLAGPVYANRSAGAGPPIGACLQLLRGLDGIPGTGDDPIGRGDPNGPNPPGSSILYLPSTMVVTFWNIEMKRWDPLFTSPWPQLLTTGNASDVVIEPLSAINGANSTRTGQPWEFFAGLDHPGQQVHWKHPKCNVYVTYVTVWSVLGTGTPLGNVDVMFEVEERKVREDVLIADINGDEVCNIVDIVIAALAFDTSDEYIGPDGIPMTGDDKPLADPKYDARGDLRPTRGLVNIVDIVRIALDFDESLTSADP